MLRQAVDEAEVEIAKELGIVLKDDEEDPHDSGVEALQRGRDLLPWNHVVLKEHEALHQQVLDLALLGELIS